MSNITNYLNNILNNKDKIVNIIENFGTYKSDTLEDCNESINRLCTINTKITENGERLIDYLKYIPYIDLSSSNTCSYFAPKSKVPNIEHIGIIYSNNDLKANNMFGALTASRASNIQKVDKIDANITSANNLFYRCSNLIYFPQINLQNCISMKNLVSNCVLLTNLPKINAQSVTNITGIFSGCTELVDIESFENIQNGFDINPENIISIQNMFSNCPKLNNIILTNLPYWLANLTSYSNIKTLQYIGLSEEQSNIVITSQYWNEAEAKGWTKGY